MNNLKLLNIRDNFDVWRDNINDAIKYVNNIQKIDLIPSSTTDTSLFLTIKTDDSNNIVRDDTTGIPLTMWKPFNTFLKDLGIEIESGQITFTGTEAKFPDGLDVGNNAFKVLANGSLNTQGDIISKNIVSEGLSISSVTPAIHFKYKNSTQSTSTIIEQESGVLSINGHKFSSNTAKLNKEVRIANTINDAVLKNDNKYFSISFNKTGSNTSLYTQSPLTIDIESGSVNINHGLNVSNIKCLKNIQSNSLTVDNTAVLSKLEVKNNTSVAGNLNVGGVLTASSIKFDNVDFEIPSSISSIIRGKENSSFESDLYINSPSDSFIISTKDINDIYFLLASTPNGNYNNLRPFTINKSTGKITLGHQLLVTGSAAFKNTVSIAKKLTVSGDLNCAGELSANKVHNAIWNDYAEFFEKGEETEVGDIIALDISSNEEKYIKATNSRHIVGVHSDTYGHIVGGTDSISESNKFFIPVGMIGRVKTKIIGSISIGDEVVLSNIPGVGRKFNPDIDRERDIIGFVVETNLSEEIKLVNMKI